LNGAPEFGKGDKDGSLRTQGKPRRFSTTVGRRSKCSFYKGGKEFTRAAGGPRGKEAKPFSARDRGGPRWGEKAVSGSFESKIL